MQFYDVLNHWLGLEGDPQQLTFLQMSLRGVIVFIVSLVMLRLSARRFLPHKTAFDAILFFILASMLSRAINGSAAFFPTLGVGFVLVAVHWVIAALSCRHSWFSELVKGDESVLIRDGEVQADSLRKELLSHEDLMEELRLNGNIADPAQVREARYERSGEISVVKKG